MQNLVGLVVGTRVAVVAGAMLGLRGTLVELELRSGIAMILPERCKAGVAIRIGRNNVVAIKE